jgi:RNA polymerase sigma-70 factor (ECF subfamily)
VERLVKGVLVPLRQLLEGPEAFSDAAIVAACATGEPAALGVLFDRFHTRTSRFISRLIGSDGPDVDDLVQATFLEAWRSASRFKGRSSASTWILGIAANLARHHIRSERSRCSALVIVTRAPVVSPITPDVQVSGRELVARVAGALEALPHPLREAFVLCDIEEVPGTEAAQALGVREGTLWRRLHQARRALRDVLKGEGA